MNKQNLPRVGVGAVIVDDDNRILMVLRKREPECNKWSIPGGKVEAFELLEEAVVREIKEEVNLEVKVEQLLCTAETINEEKHEHWISLIYQTKHIDGNLVNLEPEKHEDVKWFPIHELPSNLANFTMPAIQTLRKR